MTQPYLMSDADLRREANDTRLTSKSTAAERERAVALLDELAVRLGRRIQTQTIGCSPDRCNYPIAVGLAPGADVSIDGDVWPGSRFDRHLDTCPSIRPRTPSITD
ncbi:hypothetical protein [Microbacterium sp.]|jgi:hypothetical protein|uniref:hypothetical protein n=1 Tax=Microbacterium sp. TaxID=51671 RepID=UPI0037C64F11